MNWSFSRLGFAMLLVCFLGLAALPRDSRIALTHAQADAQDGAPIIGQIGGETRAVLLRGDLAYVGIGPRFTVLDLSEPNAPAVIHRSQPLPNVIQAIVRQGDYAYVACGEACGLRVFDVSEPGQPRIIGAASTPGLALDLAVEDEVLVLADGVRGLHSNNFGLRVFDIGNPRRPQEIAVVEGIGARRVIMGGGTAFVTTGRVEQRHDGRAASPGDLEIIDLSTPDEPQKLRTYAPNDLWSITAVDVRDELLAISYGNSSGFTKQGGVYLLDISNPIRPKRISEIVAEDMAFDVVLDEDRLYFSEGLGEEANLHTVDISTLAEPWELNVVQTPGLAYRLFVGLGQVLVADGHQGASLFKISGGILPKLEGRHVEAGNTSLAVLHHESSLHVGGFAELHSFEEAAPEHFQPTDRRALTYGFLRPESIASVNDRLLVAHSPMGLSVMNADPDSKGQFFDDFASRSDLAVVDDVAFVSGWDHEAYGQDTAILESYDLSNPDDPKRLDRIVVEPCGPNYGNEDAYQLDVNQGIALLADTGCGIRVVDVQDPANLSLLRTADIGKSVQDLVLDDDWMAYVVTPYQTLHVMDFGNPLAPRVLSEISLGDDQYSTRRIRIAQEGNRALVSIEANGLTWIDLSDLEQPLRLRRLHMPLPWRDLQIDTNRAYVAGGTAGTWMLDLEALDRIPTDPRRILLPYLIQAVD